MTVRGYSGKIAGEAGGRKISRDDYIAVTAGIVIFTLSIAIKMDRSLFHSGLYALIIAAIILIVTTAYVGREDL